MSLRSSLLEKVDRAYELVKALSARANVPEVPVYEVDANFVIGAIARKLPRPEHISILDGRYRTTTIDGFREIVRWDATNMRRYILDFWDCDNYAFRFKSNVESVFMINAVGYVIDLSVPECAHAYNVFIDNTGNVYVYEPQTDVIMMVDEARRDCKYRMEHFWVTI